MAAYTGTPTIVSAYEVGDRNGKRVGVRRILTLTLTAQGGATNSIGYAALGFASAQILSVHAVNFTDNAAQNRGIIAWTDKSLVLLGDPQVVTDADRCEPIDLTGTLTIDCFGLPA